ncbi:hydroxysqualene dehydroxylase HpnE [Pararhodospirillum oryzae]|uniref:Amine oxidase n=1 Tax=Pararhodospirillum oryzae TaxID=478448 RepID=A0A512H9N0_9PROT|nr:hydroxysqualene dehydroxylase HpnE [Pararhodospirillum oryzae]GEO82138.1 amine oxidase [Pararhodospirillum oryzae]
MSAPVVHVIGAGVAGLAAAVRLTGAGARVSLIEGAPQAGGRCRSFPDARLGRVLDNGTHLLLSGNQRVRAYLDTIGAADALVGPPRARLDFFDARTKARWTLAPNPGLLPWWILDPARRIPGTRARDYLEALRLLTAAPDATVAQALRPGTALYERLWAPLCVAVLNTAPEEACARLLAPVLRETFGRGEAACRPRVARESLSATFIDPALAWLTARGGTVRLGCRVDALDLEGGRVRALRLAGGDPVPVGAADRVVLAVPAWVAGRLVPGLRVPTRHHPIVNLHFRLDRAPEAADERVPLGLLGGVAEWAFVRGDVLSVTISAARALDGADSDTVATGVWAELREALPSVARGPCPAFRLIREHRATLAQTPVQEQSRPARFTEFANLFLAGDWTATGLPATIEGAIRSGEAAGDAALH